MSKYLLQDTEETREMVEQLNAMLLSQEESNIKLATQIMKGAGAPMPLWGALLAIVLLYKRKKEIAEAAYNLLEENVPEEYLSKYNQYIYSVNYIVNQEESKITTFFETITNEDNYDMYSFLWTLFVYTKKGGNYFLKHKLVPIKTILSELYENQRLSLEGYQLEQLPEEIAEFTQLYYLNISHMQISHVPDSFQKLTQLQDIQFTNTTLTAEASQKLEQFFPTIMGYYYYNKACDVKSKAKQKAGSTFYMEAVQWFEKGTMLIPEYAEGWHNVGACYIFFKTPEKGKKALHQAIELYTKRIEDNQEIAYNTYWKACVYALLKEEEQALKYLKQACQLNQSYKQAAQEEEDFKEYRKNKQFKEITKK
ncbi:MAG: hypothetical protein EAZ55_12860 [Cytophagales bacterium]|nr:MAG: hypothetical protein EAZ55_12860 [Cytophagales bacterium]